MKYCFKSRLVPSLREGFLVVGLYGLCYLCICDGEADIQTGRFRPFSTCIFCYATAVVRKSGLDSAEPSATFNR